MVGASIGGLKSGLKGGVKLVAGFAASVKGTLGGIGGLLAGVGAVAGLKTAAESMDATAKAADRLGIGIEAFVGLQHAANLSNVDIAALNLGLTKMEDNLATAATKGGPVEKVLNGIGLKSKNLVNLKPDEAFGKIADGIMSIQNPSQRTAAAMDIFGKSGAMLIPLLKEGSAGFAKFRAEAKRLGLSFSEVDAAKIDAADDAVTKLKASFKGAFQQLAIGLSPAITLLGENGSSSFADISRSVGDFVSNSIKEIGFFVGTANLQWERLKLDAQIVWNFISASGIAAFESLKVAMTGLGEHWKEIIADIENKSVIAPVTQGTGKFLTQAAAGIKAFAGSPMLSVRAGMAAFKKIGQEITEGLPGVIKSNANIGNKFRSDVAETFKNELSKNIDADLLAQSTALDAKLKDVRRTFDETGKGPPLKPKERTGASAFTGLKTVGGVSSQVAAATQIGTTEAASQITASMTAFNKKDDQIEKNTGLTVQKLEEIKKEISENSVPDFDMIPAF